MTPSRRDLLTLASSAAVGAVVGTATTATAGARAQSDDDERPAYSRWLTADDGRLEFAAVDWPTVAAYVGDELEEGSPDETDVPAEYEADPMIAPVSDGLIQSYFFVGIDLAQYRLGRLLDTDDAFESTVEGLVLTDEAFVVIGSMVSEEIDAQLTAEPEADFIRQLERTDEIDGYDVYTPVEGEIPVAIGVGSDALVVVDGQDGEPASDPIATLETTINAATGDGERATDEFEAFGWAVDTAGNGDVVVGQYGAEPNAQPDDQGVVEFAFEGLEDAETIVSSLTIEDEETSTGQFAAIIADPDEDVLEEVLGASADEQSVDVDGEQVTATGTWRAEELTVDQLV